MARVAMATQEASTAIRLPASYYMRCLLFLLIAVGTMNTPALAGHSSPPSTLVVYAFQKNFPPDATIVEVASPSGNLSAMEFGTTYVVDEVLRETEAADSSVLGSIKGLVLQEKGTGIYVSTTFVFNTTSFAGSISLQGYAFQFGTGEVPIVGGTNDFRFARGYTASVVVPQEDPGFTVFKTVFTLKYD